MSFVNPNQATKSNDNTHPFFSMAFQNICGEG